MVSMGGLVWVVVCQGSVGGWVGLGLLRSPEGASSLATGGVFWGFGGARIKRSQALPAPTGIGFLPG